MELIQFLKSWVQQIVIALVLTSLLELLLPGGQFKKYVRVVTGLVIILLLLQPLLILTNYDQLTIFSMSDWNYDDGLAQEGEIDHLNDELIREEFARQIQLWVTSMLAAFPEVERSETEVRVNEENQLEQLTAKVWLARGRGEQGEGVVSKIRPVKVKVDSIQQDEQIPLINQVLEEKLQRRLCDSLGLQLEQVTVLLFE